MPEGDEVNGEMDDETIIYLDSDWTPDMTAQVCRSAAEDELYPIVSEADGGIIGYILGSSYEDAAERLDRIAQAIIGKVS